MRLYWSQFQALDSVKAKETLLVIVKRAHFDVLKHKKVTFNYMENYCSHYFT